MSRSQRLLDLLQVLRRHRRPVSGRKLATETGVSIRTLYRDIATLQAQGAQIDGEPGIGYVLRPGFMLPPLMFSAEEIEALVLGSRWVARRADEPLAKAAQGALAKIAAVLPDELRYELEASPLLVGPGTVAATPVVDPAVIRRAIKEQRRMRIDYTDAGGSAGERVIWPFALAFFENVRIVVAWCELREDFRSFRLDRIGDLRVLDDRYPRRRQTLMAEWKACQNIAPQM